MTSAQRRQGFSRVDLAVVLVMTAILLGLFFPAVYAAQVAGGKKETQQHLKMMMLAVHSCQDAYGKVPPASGKFPNNKGLNATLHIHTLPFLEQDPLFQQYLKAGGKKVAPVVVPFFVSKSDPSVGEKKREGIQNFAVNLRVFSDKGHATMHDKDMPALAAMEPASRNLVQAFKDGTSVTIAFTTKFGYCDDGGSRYASTPDTSSAAFFGQNAARKKADPSDPSATFQLRPGPKECRCAPLMAQSFFKTGLWVAMGDGSVREVSPKVSPETWNAAMQPNDGNLLGPDW